MARSSAEFHAAQHDGRTPPWRLHPWRTAPGKAVILRDIVPALE
jgi:hypothetical protein